MPVFPLTEETRDQLVYLLHQEIGGKDPLPFLQKHIFEHYPSYSSMRILPQQSLSSWMYYRTLIRNIELSAWAARPPLLVALLRAFPQAQQYQAAIMQILREGPFQCHPQISPYWVCRVATELPLVGREWTRAAGMAFDMGLNLNAREGKRVLRVFGPPGSGKTHTLNFFKYLENVQPLMLGVVEVDFEDKEMTTQAASTSIYIESFLAQRMETQLRRRRGELEADRRTAAGDFPDLAAIANATPALHQFKPLTDLQQRNRWAKELANEFVDQVLYRQDPVPTWWVVVFDNCEKAPAEAHEFVRRLVERAAGTSTDLASVSAADRGQLRVVLLGDSDNVLPANLYQGHVLEEDLKKQSLGKEEVERYFITFGECREIELDAAQIQKLTEEALARANQMMQVAGEAAPSWPRALATAIIEKTLPLDALAAQKKEAKP